MGRAPCCDKAKVKRGPWSPEEDIALKSYVERHGTGGNWIALPHKAGLKRCGKSCRLRWLNYLRPDIKHGGFTEEEDNIIYNLYRTMGSRWSIIASHLPGRTDNDVKNYWNTKLKKKFFATKSNLTTNANAIANDHIQLSSSPSPHVIKTESCTNGFWAPLRENSTSLPSIDVGFGYNVESQRSFADPISFPLPVLKESSDYGVIANSYEASSSSLPMDNSYYSQWPSSGSDDVDGFILDHAYGSPYELLNSYGFQTVASSETKPQGLFQGVTY
ncbi:hypothetical protein MRB53_006671 [Persea americana]|uniref:Uncharacterized protein n=1 Tax=Persea americana TaxID=3435 RepID=A0ACC2MHQ9_PERAE|nr:hypothetical protein MRB53_006671 [Persea americana]|eukprot:TRINITY_DN16649_c0_g2_i1.p1 TRINITY_DN16649_c0_g2~~TRINITY_DN16649_c0_g2_i1.p1  ORF type:complete len:274 (+),score=60.40 TRINITY_DN16649_c0_g2_i1:23-844(+)